MVLAQTSLDSQLAYVKARRDFFGHGGVRLYCNSRVMVACLAFQTTCGEHLNNNVSYRGQQEFSLRA